MIFRLLISFRFIRYLGFCIAVIGLLDSVVAMTHAHIGFGPVACVISVFYIRYSRRQKPQPFVALSVDSLLKRLAFVTFSISIIDACMSEIAIRLPLIANSESFGYVAFWVLLMSLCIAMGCVGFVFSNWLLR